MNATKNVTTTRDKVATLHDAGLIPREIAGALNLSTARIYQILKHDLELTPNRKPRKKATA